MDDHLPEWHPDMQILMHLVRNDSGVSSKNLEFLGIPRETIKVSLRRLRRAGDVKMTGNRRTALYFPG